MDRREELDWGKTFDSHWYSSAMDILPRIVRNLWAITECSSPELTEVEGCNLTCKPVIGLLLLSKFPSSRLAMG
ncbi:MAG: hypothetical protein ACFBSC_13575 [Microcoleaceae cyanobacterium]